MNDEEMEYKYDWKTWNCITGVQDTIHLANNFDSEGEMFITTKDSYTNTQTTQYFNREQITQMVEHLQNVLNKDNKAY